MYVRTENGKSYVMARGEDGKLEQRWVQTGKVVWDSYTQIRGGLTQEDYVAFPYGRDVVSEPKRRKPPWMPSTAGKEAVTMLENINLALQGVWSHKLRSFLTMLGIIIGIAAIITIVSTIRGTNEQIKQNLIGAGNDMVQVQLTQDSSTVDFSYGGAGGGIAAITSAMRDEMDALPASPPWPCTASVRGPTASMPATSPSPAPSTAWTTTTSPWRAIR